jgi:hypothetical protein
MTNLPEARPAVEALIESGALLGVQRPPLSWSGNLCHLVLPEVASSMAASNDAVMTIASHDEELLGLNLGVRQAHAREGKLHRLIQQDHGEIGVVPSLCARGIQENLEGGMGTDLPLVSANPQGRPLRIL